MEKEEVVVSYQQKIPCSPPQTRDRNHFETLEKFQKQLIDTYHKSEEIKKLQPLDNLQFRVTFFNNHTSTEIKPDDYKKYNDSIRSFLDQSPEEQKTSLRKNKEEVMNDFFRFLIRSEACLKYEELTFENTFVTQNNIPNKTPIKMFDKTAIDDNPVMQENFIEHYRTRVHPFATSYFHIANSFLKILKENKTYEIDVRGGMIELLDSYFFYIPQKNSYDHPDITYLFFSKMGKP